MATLEAGQVALTRKAYKQEYIQNLLPVFYADKVSFTCKNTIKIQINEKSETCNQAIHFIEKPTTLKLNDVNDNVWKHVDSHTNTFFLQALDWQFEQNKQVPPPNLWSTTTNNPHIFEVIGEHFKALSPIESGLWSSLAIVILIVILSIPVLCFFLCPRMLKVCLPQCCINCMFKQINDKIFSHRELSMP